MKNFQSGITIAEVVIIIAIVAILAVISIGPLSAFRQKQALQNTTNAVVSILNEARTKTLAGYDDTSYGVHIESGKITLFTGTSYSSSTSTNENFFVESPVTLSWSLAGSASEILFTRLTGTTNQYGTITLTLPSGSTRTITITQTGSVTRN